jgi:hypothetical protein
MQSKISDDSGRICVVAVVALRQPTAALWRRNERDIIVVSRILRRYYAALIVAARRSPPALDASTVESNAFRIVNPPRRR